MNNKVIIGIVVIIVIILGGVWWWKASTSSPVTNPAVEGGTSAPLESTNPNAGEPASSTNGQTSTTGQSYTLAQIKTHNSATSCWTTINGKVYDVTKWINQHPSGAQAILGLCGTDGTAAFNGQHGGQARPASELATFYIGELGQ